VSSHRARLDELIQEVSRFGVAKTIQDLAWRGLNRLISVRILKGIRIESVRSQFLEFGKPYKGEFLGEDFLKGALHNHPEYEMSERFVRQAFANGDKCYGFLDGAVLVAYGWFSNRPTAIDAPRMLLHFDNRYIYMYKAFTHVKYRGQRLQATLTTRVLEAYLANGYKGFLAYVDWNNFSSLKSCYRLGYTDFGNVYLARVFGRYFTRADGGCAKYAFRLDQTMRSIA
jgi:hypothetical protein